MKKNIFFISLMYVAVVSARYATIESPSELDRKLNSHQYSIVCFADSESQIGKEVNRNMRKASNQEEFGSMLQDKVGFWFVRSERDKNHDLVASHGYRGQPFCATFKRDYTTKSSNMSGDFSEKNMRHFLRGEFDTELDELVDKIEEKREREAAYYDDLSPRTHVSFGVGTYPWYYRWWYGPRYYRYGRPYVGYRHHGSRHHGHRRHRR